MNARDDREIVLLRSIGYAREQRAQTLSDIDGLLPVGGQAQILPGSTPSRASTPAEASSIASR